MNIAGNKKALSQALLRVLTVALVLACAAAFMPLLSGQAFAASKPAKVKFKSLTQADVMTSVGQYKITAKWKKAKKAKKYKVTYTDGSETKSITTKKKAASFEGAVGSTYNVKVQGIHLLLQVHNIVVKTSEKWFRVYSLPSATLLVHFPFGDFQMKMF